MLERRFKNDILSVLSDGGMHENPSVVSSALRAASDAGVFVVLLVLEVPGQGKSILDKKASVWKDDGSVELVPYMETFPFPYYIFLRDPKALPAVMADALRQWFEMVNAAATV